MRVYLLSCIVAAIVAAGAIFVLNVVQKGAEVAYATSGARI
jgi:hypothetical protein